VEFHEDISDDAQDDMLEAEHIAVDLQEKELMILNTSIVKTTNSGV